MDRFLRPNKLDYGMNRKRRAAAESTTAKLLMKLAPQVRLELTTLRLTAECSAIELLRNKNRHFGELKD